MGPVNKPKGTPEMADNKYADKVLVIRLNPKVGSGRTEVFHLGPEGEEELQESIDYKWPGLGLKELTPMIQASIAEGLTRGVIDLVNVPWIDSTGLGLLVTVLHDFKKNDGVAVFANPTERVANIIEVTGLDRPFPVFKSLEAARTFLLSEEKPEAG